MDNSHSLRQPATKLLAIRARNSRKNTKKAYPREIPTEILSTKGENHLFQIHFNSSTRKGSGKRGERLCSEDSEDVEDERIVEKKVKCESAKSYTK
ncbi:hypothetical protein Tco_1047885 [Tanacetum coccineum]